MLRQVFCGQSLDREAHVHDLRRMSVSGRQVHQTSFCQDTDPLPGGQLIALDIFSHLFGLDRHFTKAGHIDLAVEVARVAEDGALLHLHEILRVDDLVAARYGHEEVSQLCRFLHGHHVKAVHHRLDGLHGIDLRHDDSGAKALRPHGDALAAPAVAGDDHDLARHDQVGGAVDAVPYGLARAVSVVKEMLALRVVDADHGEGQISRPVHGLQADDAGGGLLTAAQDVRDQIAHLGVHHVHQIAAVVDDDVGARGQRSADMGVVFLLRGSVPGMYLKARLYQGRCHVVLCGKRVGAGHIHFRAACRQHLAQVRGLGLQMHGKGDLLSRKGLRPTEFLLQRAKQVAVSFYPLDFLFAGSGQVDVSDLAAHFLFPFRRARRLPLICAARGGVTIRGAGHTARPPAAEFLLK